MLDGSGAEIAARLDAFDADRERADKGAIGGRVKRLGHYRVTTGGARSPETALLCEAADGIRTHDLLHGKQTL
jgi:hypothetical protein